MSGGTGDGDGMGDDEDFFDGTVVSTAAAEKGLKEQQRKETVNVHQMGRTATSNEQQMPPVNKTLLSTGEHRIIIIKPEGGDGRELINNPIKLNTILEQSVFGKLDIKDIRVNKRKEMVIIELEEANKAKIDEVLKVKQIQGYSIKVYTPEQDAFKAGVIWPVSKEADLEELRRHIVIDNEEISLHEIERLKKKVDGRWTDSESVKLIVKGPVLPEAVKIARSFYKVRPFVNMPLQCFKCQRIGHTAINCKGNTRCMLCGDNHDRKECKSLHRKCVGCGGNHVANDKECILIKRAKEIEHIKAKGGTHVEAYSRVYRNTMATQEQTNGEPRNMSDLQTHTIQAEVHHRMDSQVTNRSNINSLYSEIAGRGNTQDLNRTLSRCNCKCDNITETRVEEIVDKIMSAMMEKIGKLLVEVFSSSILKESNSNKQLIIRNLMKNVINKEIEIENATDNMPNTSEQSHNKNNRPPESEDEAVLSNYSSDSMEGNKIQKKGQTKKMKVDKKVDSGQKREAPSVYKFRHVDKRKKITQ